MDIFTLFLINVALTAAIALLAPKPKFERPSPATLKDFSFPTNSNTRAVPAQWGRCMVDGPNVLWVGDFAAIEVTKKVRTGLRSQRVTLGYNYHLGAAFGLHAGGGARLREIWVGDKLAWKGNIGNGEQAVVNLQYGDENARQGVSAAFEFWSGSVVPSLYLQSQLGASNTPSWPHLTYVVMRGPSQQAVDLPFGVFFASGWVGMSATPPQLKFVTERMPGDDARDALCAGSQPLIDRWNAAVRVCTAEANPALALAELCVNTDWGAGIPPSLLNAESFISAAERLKQESNGLCLHWDTQRGTDSVSEEVQRQIGGAFRHNFADGTLVLQLLRPDDVAVATLNNSNIITWQDVSSTSVDEAANEVQLQFIDRHASYRPQSVVAQNLGGIAVAGGVISQTLQYPGLGNKNSARAVAARDLRSTAVGLRRAMVTAFRPANAVIQQGDLVLVSRPDLSITNLRMRVASVQYTDSLLDEVRLELIEDFAYPAVAECPFEPDDTLPGEHPRPTIIAFRAPKSLTEQTADHLLCYAIPPDSTPDQRRWTAAFYDADDSAIAQGVPIANIVEWLPGINVGMSARGVLVGALGSFDRPADLTVSLSGENYEIARRAANAAQVLVRVQNADGNNYAEFVVAQSVQVAAGQVVLKNIKRACHGTFPVSHSDGATVDLILDYAVCPVGLRTKLLNNSGNAVLDANGPGYQSQRLLARGYGLSRVSPVQFALSGSAAEQGVGLGYTMLTGSVTPPGALGIGYIAPPPGRVRLQSVTGAIFYLGFGGAYSNPQLPQVSAPAQSVITLSWSHRSHSDFPGSWDDIGTQEPGWDVNITASWQGLDAAGSPVGGSWTALAGTQIGTSVQIAVPDYQAQGVAAFLLSVQIAPLRNFSPGAIAAREMGYAWKVQP